MFLSVFFKGYLWFLFVINEKNFFVCKYKYYCFDFFFFQYILDYDWSFVFEWIMWSESGINLKIDMFRQLYVYGYILVIL